MSVKRRSCSVRALTKSSSSREPPGFVVRASVEKRLNSSGGKNFQRHRQALLSRLDQLAVVRLPERCEILQFAQDVCLQRPERSLLRLLSSLLVLTNGEPIGAPAEDRRGREERCLGERDPMGSVKTASGV